MFSVSSGPFPYRGNKYPAPSVYGQMESAFTVIMLFFCILESLIPVKKEERAVPLLRQLLGELSPDARERLNGEAGPAGEVPEIRLISENKSASAAAQSLPAVREAFAEPALTQTMMAASDEMNRIPDEGISGIFAKLGDLLSVSLHDVLPSVVQNTSQNVSAPVTIQVHSTGASAEQVGQKLYDTAERYLLRTLKTAFQP